MGAGGHGDHATSGRGAAAAGAAGPRARAGQGLKYCRSIQLFRLGSSLEVAQGKSTMTTPPRPTDKQTSQETARTEQNQRLHSDRKHFLNLGSLDRFIHRYTHKLFFLPPSLQLTVRINHQLNFSNTTGIPVSFPICLILFATMLDPPQ